MSCIRILVKPHLGLASPFLVVVEAEKDPVAGLKFPVELLIRPIGNSA